MPERKDPFSPEERLQRGQSLPLGDTGDGDTGVPANEQGISNRVGDQGEADAAEPGPDADADGDELEELDKELRR